jgi:antitoxin component of MazEF toxin-antitoxin module
MSTIVKADATGAVLLPADLCRTAGVTPGADLRAEIEAGRIVVAPTGNSLCEPIAGASGGGEPTAREWSAIQLRSSSFAFWDRPEEDIYTMDDGEPV